MIQEPPSKAWIPLTAAIITGACAVIAAIVALGAPFAERMADRYYPPFTPTPNFTTSTDYMNNNPVVVVEPTQQLEDSSMTRETINLPFGEATLFDGFSNYGTSGYKFSSSSVVSWDSDLADLLVAKPDPNSQVSFFMQYGAEPYNDPKLDRNAHSGVIKMSQSQIYNVGECPDSGYQYHWAEAIVNGVYCVRTRDGSHYAIIQVTSIDSNSLSFTWIYQPDGSRKFQ